MYSDWVWLLGLVIVVWLSFLSFLIWKQSNFLNLFFPKTGERDIRKKFEEILNIIEEFKSELVKTEGKISNLETEGLKHLQAIELLRYNPYDNTGGDQSFTISLLDGKGDGVVVTSLHARSGTRVFAKPVSEGKGHKYELSKEEQEVVGKTMVIKK